VKLSARPEKKPTSGSEEVAEATGLDVKAIYRLESGECATGERYLSRIACFARLWTSTLVSSSPRQSPTLPARRIRLPRHKGSKAGSPPCSSPESARRIGAVPPTSASPALFAAWGASFELRSLNLRRGERPSPAAATVRRGSALKKRVAPGPGAVPPSSAELVARLRARAARPTRARRERDDGDHGQS